MTQEEIESIAETECKKLLKSEKGYNGISFQEFWAEGVKWGMEHAIEWHDLREDPNDLPKENGRYCGFYDYGLRYREIFWSDNQFDVTGVIAWCELPKFKE